MDINKIMQQAQAMQKQIEQMSEQISAMEFTGSASNGLVKVTVSGDHKVLDVTIDEAVIDPQDREMLQDMIMIAVNDAIEKADEKKKESFGPMASALGVQTR